MNIYNLFISVINQLDAQKFLFYRLWYHQTYRCDNTRGCVMQFWPPDDEHICSKHVEAWNKTYCEILCIKLVKNWDKYTEMHGQRNVKIYNLIMLWYLRCTDHFSTSTTNPMFSKNFSGQKILNYLIIYLRFKCLFNVELPEDYLKKMETYRSISELYVEVYLQYFWICWC